MAGEWLRATRKPRERIMIGDEIEVTVLAVQGETVRLGIRSPADVPVFRAEAYLEIQRDRAKGPAHRREPGSGSSCARGLEGSARSASLRGSERGRSPRAP